MKIKPVVKVMNFHSLLRVEKTKKKAQKYLQVENQIKLMIDVIMNNRNIKLSKLVLQGNKGRPKLNIYLGSDFGFCSFFNSRINEQILHDTQSHKILIGSKLSNQAKNVVLHIRNDELLIQHAKITSLINEGIALNKYSEVHIIYNQYKNTTLIDMSDNCLFPLIPVSETTYIEDFVYEGDIRSILTNLISLYIIYELTLCNISSHAAENILRQESTSKSLKKIDELEEIANIAARKEKKAMEFKKVIDTFARLESFKK